MVLDASGLKQVKHTETYQPNPDIVAEYEAAINARSVYALVPHGARRPNGSQVYMCPAAAGKLRCPLVESSALLALGTMPAANPPAKARPDTVCSAKFRTFTAEELPLSQRHVFGSTAWRKSYSRRGEVERHFARTKDHSQENIRRGSIRVMGLTKVGLLISFSLASVNRRLAAQLRAQQEQEAGREARMSSRRLSPEVLVRRGCCAGHRERRATARLTYVNASA